MFERTDSIISELLNEQDDDLMDEYRKEFGSQNPIKVFEKLLPKKLSHIVDKIKSSERNITLYADVTKTQDGHTIDISGDFTVFESQDANRILAALERYMLECGLDHGDMQGRVRHDKQNVNDPYTLNLKVFVDRNGLIAMILTMAGIISYN